MPNFLDFEYGDDTSNIYANMNSMAIEFTHLPSGQTVRFKAFLTNLSDSFKSDYNSTSVYGRNDPIMTFKGTSRSISLGWKVVAGSVNEAINNLERINLLTQFLYPAYSSHAIGADVLAKAPLVKVRFANLVVDSDKTSTTRGDDAPEIYDGGLVVTLSGLEVVHSLDDGGFDTIPALSGDERLPESISKPLRPIGAKAGGVFLPKTINLSTNLTVLHQHNLGWKNKKWMGTSTEFPYNTFGDVSDADNDAYVQEINVLANPPEDEDRDATYTEAEAAALDAFSFGEVTDAESEYEAANPSMKLRSAIEQDVEFFNAGLPTFGFDPEDLQMSRYDNTKIIVTDDELYDALLEQRDRKRITHYSTSVLRHPNAAERARLIKIKHIWNTSDSLMKLAHKYYGDVRLWWVIAWYNTGPTDAHYKLGEVVYIPRPLSEVLFILRSY